MTVEVATKISELVATNPAGSDPKSEGDNHLRLIKGVLQDVFDDSGDTLKTTLPVESPDGAVFGTASFAEIDVDQIDTKIVNPLEIVDAADKVRATIAADETAATGGVTITAFDDAGTPDQEAQLSILPTVLRYSGDDATRIFELDQSRQPSGNTHKLYVPERVSESVSGLWEPIAKFDQSIASSLNFINLSAFRALKITAFVIPVANTTLSLRTSTNNGSSWDAGASDYNNQTVNAVGTSVSTAATANAHILLTALIDGNTGAMFEAILEGFNLTTVLRAISNSHSRASGNVVRNMQAGSRESTVARNALQMFGSPVTTIQMRGVIEGIRT